MKSLTKVLIFSLLLILAGFTAENQLRKAEEPNIKEEKSPVSDVINHNLMVINYIDKGSMVASWYGGAKFDGKLTANGETYDQDAFTAAHRNYRFGTLLRLTNPENNQTCIVRINDRGPFVRGRQIDVSKAAAEELGIMEKGVAKLQVEQISLKGVNFPVISFN